MKNNLISFLWHENEAEVDDESIQIVHAKMATYSGDTYTFCGMDCTLSCSDFEEREIQKGELLNCPECIDRIKERVAEVTPLKKLLKDNLIT